MLLHQEAEIYLTPNNSLPWKGSRKWKGRVMVKCGVDDLLWSLSFFLSPEYLCGVSQCDPAQAHPPGSFQTSPSQISEGEVLNKQFLLKEGPVKNVVYGLFQYGFFPLAWRRRLFFWYLAWESGHFPRDKAHRNMCLSFSLPLEFACDWTMSMVPYLFAWRQ